MTTQQPTETDAEFAARVASLERYYVEVRPFEKSCPACGAYRGDRCKTEAGVTMGNHTHDERIARIEAEVR